MTSSRGAAGRGAAARGASGRPAAFGGRDAGRLLAEGLSALGIPDADGGPYGMRGAATLIPLLERYMRELELFNAAFDLVGADTRADLVVRHLLDSLAPWRPFLAALGSPSAPSGAAGVPPVVADAGTGAGFPGIPLALLFPGISFTLIERMSKRCAFLENCRAFLGLANAEILESEIERAPGGAHDAVVFRAFRPLDAAMYRSLSALTRPGGFLAAWKGRRAKIDEEMRGIESLAGRWSAEPVVVPFLDADERHLVTIRRADQPPG